MRTKPYIDANPGEPTIDDWESYFRLGVKLDLGCGNACRPGFIGIDRLFGCEVFPLTFADGTLLPDECAVEIVASHILEHFSHRDTQAVVNEWARVLKPGGLLRIAVPNLWFILDEMQKSNPRDLPLVQYLMGCHSDANDYHGNVFTPDRLEHYMAHAGLSDFKYWKDDHPGCSQYEVSLNMMGVKA